MPGTGISPLGIALMKHDTIVTRIVSLVSVLFHLLAIGQFLVLATTIQNNWSGQVFIILLITGGLSLAGAFVKTVAHKLSLLIIRGILILPTIVVLSATVSIEITLLFPLLAELTFLLPSYLSIIIPIFAASIAVLVRLCVSIRRIGLHSSEIDSLFILSVSLVSLVVMCNVVKYQLIRHFMIKKRLVSLEVSNADLARSNINLQNFATQAEYKGILEERKRMARDIHDSLASTLTTLVMLIESAIDKAGEENTKLRNQLASALAQAKEGFSEVSRCLQALRPDKAKELSGLSAANQLTRALQYATGIDVTFLVIDPEMHFSDERMKIVIYRVIQESVTNAMRHGHATKVIVSLFPHNAGLGLSISDNGIGIKEIKEGQGITGMRERLDSLGGSIQLTSSPNAGFNVTAWLPLEVEKHEEDSSATS